MASGLTEKQRRFVEAYMGQAAGNGTEAARLAGYKGSDSTLGAVAHENLRKPKIAAAIDERQENDPLVLDRRALQKFWSDVAAGRATTTIVSKGQVFEVEPLMKDRLRASELLAKSRGEFIDVRHIEGTINITEEEPQTVEQARDVLEQAAVN